MKKIYTLIAALASTVAVSNAQDTILFESFNFQDFYDNVLIDNGTNPPPGITPDAAWYTFSLDGNTDASGGGRPEVWFAIQPFSDVDTLDMSFPEFPAGVPNVALSSNSWLGGSMVADRWLVTESVTLRANDTLFWKSAPRQTPRYLDGYDVKISTTTNDDLAFTTTLFVAKEMTGLGADTTFSTYTFAPSGAGFVHGQDGTYIDIAGAGNPHMGRLRPFFIPLNAYAGQTVFIAFHHFSTDDNLIAIDDIMIRGNNTPTTIAESASALSLNVFPNPATENVQVNYELSSETAVTINLYDVTGKLVSTISKGNQPAGRHFAFINAAELAKGFYTVSVQTNNAISTTKLIVK